MPKPTRSPRRCGKIKPYPLHLGVTEAGEAEDGRIKSALGIGTLLEDGLGDTVRVSLTEDPELEAPVAKALIDRYTTRAQTASPVSALSELPYNPFQYSRRKSHEVANFGGTNVPRVVADYSQIPVQTTDALKAIGHFYLPEPDKWAMNDLGADYLYTGDVPAGFMLPNGLREVQNYSVWRTQSDQLVSYPMLSVTEYLVARTQPQELHARLNFVQFTLADLTDELTDALRNDRNVVGVVTTDNSHAMPELRRLFVDLINHELTLPIVLMRGYGTPPAVEVRAIDVPLYAATDLGGLLIDGFGDGILLQAIHADQVKQLNGLAFGILQAARTRITKTEYISCPSCGRTLFDLQETTAHIRQRTDHLKGVKIGIMGCIVNGPGEMADADYGYVGIGRDKIALYRGQQVMKKSVPAINAVDELIELIREDGRWLEPTEAAF